MKSILFLLLLSASIIGCSNSHYYKSKQYNTYDSARSKAMNVVLAGKITTRSKSDLKDMPYVEYEKAMKEAGYSNDIGTVAGIGLSTAKFSANMIATPGISDSLGGGIMLLHTLTKSDYDPVRYNGAIIWMPRTLVKNTKEAKIYVEKLLTDAFLNSLSDEYSYKLVERVFTPTFGNSKTYSHYIIKGGRCNADPDKECKLSILVQSPNLEKHAPNWLLTDDSYHWSPAKDMSSVGIHVKIGPKNEAGTHKYRPDRLFMTDAMLITMSALLPEWIYYYSPYSQDRNYPVVLNKGETNYFIQPKPNEDSKKVAIKQ